MDQSNNDQQAMIQEIEKFRKHLYWMNLIELIADIMVIPAFLWGAYLLRDGPPSLPIGFILVVPGAIYQF